MPVFVGLDCGGSSSRVLAVNEKGETIFQGQGGAANLASTPERSLVLNLRKATLSCPRADYVCGCFAGLLTANDRDRALYHLKHLFPTAALRAEPDYAAALYATSPQPDLCVIAGTGSLVCSSHNGKIHKSGGGGYILGDAGSAFRIGRDSLSEAFFGKPPTETMVNAIYSLFGTSVQNEIVAHVYRSSAPAALLARIAKTTGTDAVAGDPVAISIIKNNMASLAGIVARHIETHFKPQASEMSDSTSNRVLNITLAGGLWKAGVTFREIFHQELLKEIGTQSISLSIISQPPVKGAAKIALELKSGN